MRGTALGLAATLVVTGTAPAMAETSVVVGGYTFPPFVDAQAPHGGLTKGLISALNEQQDEYTFRFEKTSPRRRYKGFENNTFDVMFFEMPTWGWNKNDVNVSTFGPIMTGGEAYVARAGAVSDKSSYFKTVEDKTIAAIDGYHYGFADFKSEPAYLNKNFDINLGKKHEHNLEFVKRDRADVAVVTVSFLKLYFKQNPGDRENFAISDRLDQEYRLHVVVDGDDSPIAPGRLKAMLADLEDDGRLERLLDEFGVADQWVE